MSSVRALSAALALLLSGCAALSSLRGDPARAEGPSEAVLRARLAELASVCWPAPGLSPARVVLTFTRDAGALSAVEFEVHDGAPVSVGRCAQHLAWRFPWNGRFPETIELSPPVLRPSGWVVLAHLALLDEGSSPGRGLLDPAPRVRACLRFGQLRPALRFRVRPTPVQVTAFIERIAVDQSDARRTESEPLLTDAERCVAAVLASAVYPTSRALEFDFSDLAAAPAPAPDAEVASYFGFPGAPPSGSLPDAQVQQAMVQAKDAVASCWDSTLARRGGVAGARTLAIRVGPSGFVTGARIAPNASDLADEAVDYLLDQCLVAAVSPLLLGTPQGGAEAEVKYSWVFAHR